MRKIKLLRATYGGLPYLEGSVLEVDDGEATFAINSGAAIYADPLDEITPPPDSAAIEAAKKKADAVKKEAEDKLTPEEKKAQAEHTKKAEEDKKRREEKAKKEAEEQAKAAAERAKGTPVHEEHKAASKR